MGVFHLWWLDFLWRMHKNPWPNWKALTFVFFNRKILDGGSVVEDGLIDSWKIMWLSYLDKEVEYCVKGIMAIFVLKENRQPHIGESGGCGFDSKKVQPHHGIAYRHSRHLKNGKLEMVGIFCGFQRTELMIIRKMQPYIHTWGIGIEKANQFKCSTITH